MSTHSLAAAADDVQAIVGSGFGRLRHARYLLLTARGDQAAACAWLRALLDTRLVKTLADLRPDGRRRGSAADRAHALDEAVAVAFSHAALTQVFGRAEHPDRPFPSAFRSGMGSPARAALLGDTRGRGTWHWADAGSGGTPVHIVLAHYRATPFPPEPQVPAPLRDAQPHFDVRVVRTCPSFLDPPDGDGRSAAGYEPFGFRDGIAQPVLRGWAGDRVGADPLAQDRVVADGEFILGHDNEYGERAYCPDLADMPVRFGLNGSYMAVRQIAQNVAAFRAFDPALRRFPPPASGGAPPAGAPSDAEKLVGRRSDGTPLVPQPRADLDAFRYRTDDAEGFSCPRGAHIRRSNPRDTLGWDVDSGVAAAKLHRLLRRGRTYTAGCTGEDACGAPDQRETCGHGLFFIALGADLERQFELAQRRWIANPRFADLAAETDPLLGGAGPFSVPGLPLGRKLQVGDFTCVRGGGYFLAPGLRALHALAAAG